MSYRFIQFGSVVLPDVRIAGDFGTGPTADASVRTIGGMFDTYGAADGNLQLPYEKSYSAWIVGTEAAAQTELEALRALRGQRSLLYREDEEDNSLCWAWARCMEVPNQWQIQRKTMQPVDVKFSIQTPWYGAVTGTGWSLDTGETLDSGLFLGEDATYTLDTSPKSITLHNGGNALTRHVSLRLTAGAVAITAFAIAVGDCHLTWAGTLSIGKVLEINGRTMTITNDGTDAYNALSWGANHVTGWFLELESGDNTITVTITGGSTDSTIEFDFADGWE